MKKGRRIGATERRREGKQEMPSLRGFVAWPLRSSRRAFTLAEILVAVLITTFVAAATSIAISQAGRARDASTARLESHQRADFAASKIAVDLESAVRDPEVFFTTLRLTDQSAGGVQRDEVLVYSRSLKLIRGAGEQAEGGEYEVQYRLDAIAAQAGSAKRAPGLQALWRRCDPVPDDVPDGGGVAAVVADGILSLEMEAYDGQSWFDSWDSDLSGYPHAVKVTVTAVDDTGRYRATSRRIVALDRTPVPVTPVETTDETEGAQQPTGG
jgi:hypothetical protein